MVPGAMPSGFQGAFEGLGRRSLPIVICLGDNAWPCATCQTTPVCLLTQMSLLPSFKLTMKYLLLTAVLFWSISATAQEVTIGAFNLENLFDVWDDPYTSDGDPKPAPKLAPLGQAISAIDADILGVCEVENTASLERVISEHAPDAGFKHIFTQPTNSGRGIQLGLMSRYPVEKVTSYRFNTLSLPGDRRQWKLARDLLHATVRVGEHELHLFMAHFKSKRSSNGDPQSAAWRLAEATFARSVIDDLLAQNPQALIAFMGDLNDTANSQTLKALTGRDGLIDSHRGDLARIPTYLRKPYRDRIDFILMSPALAKHQTGADTLRDPKKLKGSDHAPVTARFKLPQ